MRQSWTDDRLDELGHRIDERFDRVDERFAHVDERFKEVDRQFEQVDRRFGEVDRRFEQVDRRFDRLEDELKTGFSQVRDEMKGVEAKIDETNRERQAEFNALQRTSLQFYGLSIAAWIGVIATQL